ncbi:MAG: branched-chain amino acid aminotransferase [Oligoflexia bacterium]|nr:branched-chain amino acid aminotransferase [Oligoflexia bacterium]
MDLKITKVSKENKKTIPVFDSNLGFGRFFSDHMFIMEYIDGKWTDPRIEPFHNLNLSPSTMVFHYGQGIFEGLKAYKREEELYLFRTKKNLERMNNSANRLVMPNFDVEQVLDAIKKLVYIEHDWIPDTKGYALYLRPTMIATETCLGVRSSNRYMFFVIAGPVGPYYPKGFNPVDIYISDKYVRAVRGGVGEAKAMGNYAASLLAQKEGQKYNCSQVLWLDGVERKYVEEVGAMNIFVSFKDELVTPMLSGSILPGITRDSVLKITRDWGMKVTERLLPIDELIEGINSGKVLEVFGVGTAAVISPVGKFVYKEQSYTVANGKTGALSQKLFDYITSLQIGLEKDTLGFVEKICTSDFDEEFLKLVTGNTKDGVKSNQKLQKSGVDQSIKKTECNNSSLRGLH